MTDRRITEVSIDQPVELILLLVYADYNITFADSQIMINYRRYDSVEWDEAMQSSSGSSLLESWIRLY